MFHIEDVLLLKDGERMQAFVRRHAITLVPGLFLALLFIVLPFFLLFPLFSIGMIGLILFALALIGGVLLAIRTLLLWDSDVLLVTNYRVVDVDQRGFFSRVVSEASLKTIQDVSWEKKGLLETLFRMGNVKIQTASTGVTICANRIARPHEIHELINDLRHRIGLNTQEGSSSSSDSLQRIAALLEKYSPEELARVESILKARERSTLTEAFFGKDGSEST